MHLFVLTILALHPGPVFAIEPFCNDALPSSSNFPLSRPRSLYEYNLNKLCVFGMGPAIVDNPPPLLAAENFVLQDIVMPGARSNMGCTCLDGIWGHGIWCFQINADQLVWGQDKLRESCETGCRCPTAREQERPRSRSTPDGSVDANEDKLIAAKTLVLLRKDIPKRRFAWQDGVWSKPVTWKESYIKSRTRRHIRNRLRS